MLNRQRRLHSPLLVSRPQPLSLQHRLHFQHGESPMSQLYLHSPATKSCVSSPLDVQPHLQSLHARSQESFPLSEAIKSPPSKLPAYKAGERKEIIKHKTKNTRDKANENDLQKQILESNKQGQNNIQHQLKEVQQKEGTQHTTAKRQTT